MSIVEADGHLGGLVAGWSPPTTEIEDVPSVRRAEELAAALDLEPSIAAGDELPVLWHWIHFLDVVPTRALGPDGHPREGHFLPPIPNRRRMFAGGRVEMTTPLTVGEMAIRQTTLVGKTVKRGRSGEMLFITLRHEYLQGGRLRMIEEQDVVYRSDPEGRTTRSHAGAELAEQTAPWSTTPNLSPALLFRFSAVTGNAHRIHYDQDYTTGEEGFPSLVVHGPLLAMYMVELARTRGGRVRSVNFRLSRPVFVEDAIRVQGRPSDDRTSAEMEVISGDGIVHASAFVSFA